MINGKEVVLIVAKCIVNYIFLHIYLPIYSVLIVAKCIVNDLKVQIDEKIILVLIVAKCIVNKFHNRIFIWLG